MMAGAGVKSLKFASRRSQNQKYGQGPGVRHKNAATRRRNGFATAMHGWGTWAK